MPDKPESYYPAAIIAIAAGVSGRTIHRRAASERWKVRTNGNEFNFIPPRPLLAQCRRLHRLVKPRGLQIDGLTHERRAEAFRVARRMDACLLLASEIDAGEGREAALIRVAHVANFTCSARSLRRWFAKFERFGVAGLAENKRGRVGAKPGRKRP